MLLLCLLVQISDVGGLALGDALKQTLCLQRLNLNHNHLGSSTLTSIADAVNVHAGRLLGCPAPQVVCRPLAWQQCLADNNALHTCLPAKLAADPDTMHCTRSFCLLAFVICRQPAGACSGRHQRQRAGHSSTANSSLQEQAAAFAGCQGPAPGWQGKPVPSSIQPSPASTSCCQMLCPSLSVAAKRQLHAHQASCSHTQCSTSALLHGLTRRLLMQCASC